MRFWIVSPFDFIPTDSVQATRAMGISRELAARGHEVVHFAGSFRHHDGAQRAQRDTVETAGERYQVRIVRSFGYGSRVSLRRLLAHRHLALRIATAFEELPRPDLVLASLPPLGAAHAATRYGRRHGVRVVVDVVDPWPDAFLVMAPPSLRPLFGAALWPLRAEVRAILREAAAATGISREYVDWARARGAREGRVFYPSADLRHFDAMVERTGGYARRGEPGEATGCVYVGSLGRSYDVETIVSAARILRDEGHAGAVFTIAGAGPKLAALREAARDLVGVDVRGFVSEEERVRLYARSHAAIACYAKGATQSVTYKVFDYLGAGLPVLCSLPGETDRMVESERVGFAYPAGDARALAALVRRCCESPEELREMSARARAFAERAGDSAVVYAAMADFLEERSGSR